MFFHAALGGKYVPRAVLFDLEPGVIGAVTFRRRSASSSAWKTSWAIRAGKNWAKGHCKRAEHEFFYPPLSCSGFCSKLRAPHRGKSLGPFVCGGRACSLCSYHEA